jgi:O-succinylbenzoic acid--CoA ligase
MSTPLYIHRYHLALRGGPANARSPLGTVEGFLLRTGDGFACVNPWPALGDPRVEELLSRLRSGLPQRLLERALACASADGAARLKGRALFDIGGIPLTVPGAGSARCIPRSHATVTGEADFPALAAAGFRTVKLKTQGADAGIAERVRAAVEAGLRVRIDCNGTGITALHSLCAFKEHIDFIEDPESYDAARWREIRAELGMPLALDRLDGPNAGGYDIRVLKPALETCERCAVPVVFTSYMDHPLGQMFAAWEASRYDGMQLEAGLLTHHLFEPDAFIQAVRSDGPQLLPAEGTGLGFDTLLDALPWQRLTGEPARLFINPRNPLHDPPRELPDGTLVFQTSGSTGEPSLVCLSREAMQANAAAVNDWLSATADDVWLRVLPDYHVGGMSIHFRAELSGSRAVVDEEKWEAQRFLRLLTEHGITLTSLVPAQVFDLVAAALRAPTNLRAVLVGGGALSDDLYHKARALGWPVLPSYGMTETASQVATARQETLPPGTGEPRSGLPPLELLPCWEARVTDESRLQLRGAPLLSGRLVRTAQGWEWQRAVDDDGWFTTADRARLDRRLLTPLGRCDRVVKVLGELVDLDALETALHRAGLPPDCGVVQAAVDERAGVRPWLVTDFPTAEDIVSAANQTLPPFARIAGVWMQELPRSALGKVRRALVEELLHAKLHGT